MMIHLSDLPASRIECWREEKHYYQEFQEIFSPSQRRGKRIKQYQDPPPLLSSASRFQASGMTRSFSPSRVIISWYSIVHTTC